MANTKKYNPISHLGKFAHPPKTNVNYVGPRPSQTIARTPKLISAKAKGKKH